MKIELVDGQQYVMSTGPRKLVFKKGLPVEVTEKEATHLLSLVRVTKVGKDIIKISKFKKCLSVKNNDKEVKK